MTGPDGRVIFWNRAAERLLGWTRAEALGHSSCEMLDASASNGRFICGAECAIIQAGLKGEDVESLDVQTRTKTGQPIRLNVSTLPLNGGPDKGSSATVHLFRGISTPSPEARSLSPAPPTTEANGAASSLTPRELEVLRLLTTGANTRAAAERLSVSPATIRNHVQNLLGKLGVHSRLQAVAYARTHGLL